MTLVTKQAGSGLTQSVTRQGRYLRSAMAIRLALLLCVLGACSRLCWAQNSKPTAVTPEPPKAQAPTDFKVPLLNEGLKLSDFTGMEPRPGLESQLARVSGFLENTPADGAPASEPTEVWIGRTKSTLYFVFICHDHIPSAIRGHLARRE